jgi:hypothetical protein
MFLYTVGDTSDQSEKIKSTVWYLVNISDIIPLDGISTLSKALCCWVRGLVWTNEL